MTRLSRLVLALLLVGAAFVLDGLGVLGSVDGRLIDGRFALSARPPSNEVVVVEIDSRSLAQVGVWPWPRSIHARLLDQLMAFDARDVAFDVDFSAASEPSQDAAFAAALERAGGFAWLAALEQNAGPDGAIHLNLPLAALRANADPVDVNVQLDRQGRVVSFPTAINSPAGALPSLAEALAGNAAPRLGTAYIDYGIDITQIDRISAADVLAGTVDPARIAGKQVIVGASAIELRDQFAAPRFGLVPGALIQAEALETVKAGRELSAAGAWPALALSLLLVLAAGVRRPGWSIARVGAAAAGTIVLVETGAWLLQLFARLIVSTAALDLSVLLLAGLWLIEELGAEYEKRRAAQRRLAYLARHDAITETLSRHGLAEEMGGATGRVSVLLVGIQRLDLVRGALGHDVGDQALARIARVLEAMNLARVSLIDRDTFALAWDGPVGGGEIEQYCRRIRQRLDSPFEAGGHSVFVDATFGWSSAVGIETVLRQAELALASERSRQPRRFTPTLEARVVAQRRIDSALRRAIDESAIAVVFQPQVNLLDGTLAGVEALARWDDRELGSVSPAEFIPLAEETGLIVKLGGLILREACRRASRWNWKGQLAVNLSPAQLQLSDVVGTVDDVLASTGFPAQRLDLEVTESLLMDLRGQNGAQFRGLRQRGIGLAIDDFGTGYSSFNYLAEFDCDKIKIDRSFVTRLGRGPQHAAVIQSIIELSHRLGRQVVAEGIQDNAQVALLRRLGCDIGQGYLLGKPMAGPQIEEIIAMEGKTGAVAG